MTVNCKMFDILWSCSRSYSSQCIPFAFTSRSRERLIVQWENNSFSSVTMLSVLAVLYKLNRREFIASTFSFKITGVMLPRLSLNPDTSLRRTVRAGPEGVRLK